MNSVFATLMHKQALELLAPMTQSGKGGKRRTKLGMALYAVLMAYAVFAMGVMFALFADMLAPLLAEGETAWLYFAIMGLFTTVIGLFGSIFVVYSALYQAKDNESLLSMPIPPRTILAVRMVSIYLMCLALEAVAWIPTMIVWWIRGTPTVLAAVLCLLTLPILPLVAVSLACLFGYLIALITSRLDGRAKQMLITVCSVLFIAVFYVGYLQIFGLLQNLATESSQAAILFETILTPLGWMGRGAAGQVLPFVLFALFALILFLLVLWLLSRNLTRLLTAHRGTGRVRARAVAERPRSRHRALLAKERARFLGSSVYMLNCGLGTVLLTGCAIFLLLRGGWLRETVLQIPGSAVEWLLPIAAAMIAMLCTMNAMTAPSISLEGNTLWILRSMPVPAWEVLRAKLSWHLWLTLPPALLCTLCAVIIFRVEVLTAALMIVCVGLFVLFTAALGLVLNLKMPNLTWTSETVAVKQGMSVMFTLFTSWAAVLILAGLYGILHALGVSGSAVFFACTAFLLLTICVALLAWLKRRGVKLFDEL